MKQQYEKPLTQKQIAKNKAFNKWAKESAKKELNDTKSRTLDDLEFFK